jgi:hypothetical protein
MLTQDENLACLFRMDRPAAIMAGLWRSLNVPQVDSSASSFSKAGRTCLIHMARPESDSLFYLKKAFPFFTHSSLHHKAGSCDNSRAYTFVQEQRNLFVHQPQITFQTTPHFSGLHTLQESCESPLYINLEFLARL